MADLGSAMIERLAAASQVAALVDRRVYWVAVPQGATLPYVRMQIVSDPRPQDLDGYEVARETRVQADCFAASHMASQAIAEAIVTATAEPATVAGVVFGRTKAEGPRDLGEDVPGGGFIHRASMDLLVWHRLA